ncbi:MAG: DUF3810 domain-containing protein [Clostridia bacterium]|nr:DUF3810 domain-containing protein [Clostridia bacterium]
MNRIRSFLKKVSRAIPRWAKISICLGLFSLVLYALFVVSPAFSDFFNRYPAAFLRAILAFISGIFPFSIAETLIILLPLILIIVMVKIAKAARGKLRETFRMFVSMVAVLALFFTSFTFLFASGYRGTTLDKKLGLERTAVSASDLDTTARALLGELKKLTPKIKYAPDGASAMPHSVFEMNDELQDAYKQATKKYDFLPDFRSRIKPVMLSEPMTHTHISGIYTFFTGESNLNTNFPDYTLPFTAAHELAHQRGIAREDEANFVAFLVCMESDDTYIRYSGYMNLFEYVLSALYEADSKAYFAIVNEMGNALIGEINAYNTFFDKYRDNVVADVSGAMNDGYLQSQGQVAGSQSYGMVVDLAVAYYKKK